MTFQDDPVFYDLIIYAFMAPGDRSLMAGKLTSSASKVLIKTFTQKNFSKRRETYLGGAQDRPVRNILCIMAIKQIEIYPVSQ